MVNASEDGNSRTSLGMEQARYLDHREESKDQSSNILSTVKLIASTMLFLSTIWYIRQYTTLSDNVSVSPNQVNKATSERRRLTDVTSNDSQVVPTYMNDLMDDLRERKKLMEETPPEEVKYWFEYTGPLQKYFYRYSKSRKKADSFEGRDDSGVTSSRFIQRPGGGMEYTSFFAPPSFVKESIIPESERAAHSRLLDNCLDLGGSTRPKVSNSGSWLNWFEGEGPLGKVQDRCRVLVVLNTVGAGHGSTMLWETQPPAIHVSSPKPWISEQETAVTHLERNLKEIDAMCATGLMAVRVQILVCEPIPGEWTDWMDSMLPNCGGKKAPFMGNSETLNGDGKDNNLKERSSPVQIVIVANAVNADTCHDLKSGFMEKRLQDLILAPPYLTKDNSLKGEGYVDPAVKTTHPDLVSSADHDLYIAMKWSSLVTVRAVYAFLQASADIAAASTSPHNQYIPELENDVDGVTITLNNHSPSSPFLLPSFVRVSYVSEENNKVAKWRMHGDFFHPAAWEVCKDSFDMTWIPDSLSGNGGINGICYEGDNVNTMQRKLGETGNDCGQWWIFMAEEQMPLTPEVYANEVITPLVQGGSNYFWMITERQRKEIVRQKVCEHKAHNKEEIKKNCGEIPQAVIPLGDLESFLINFTPNTALGKKHNSGRRPGYSKEADRKRDRELARERKQLKGQTDIEKALFDYTVYPVALFRKDATVKAARVRDKVLTKKQNDGDMKDLIGPQTVRSSYYDITITKPREPTLSWCQAIARKGLCTLYAEYFRESPDTRCLEACGMKKNWSMIQN